MTSPTTFVDVGGSAGQESVEPPELVETAFAGTTSPQPQRRASVDHLRPTAPLLSPSLLPTAAEQAGTPPIRQRRAPTPTTSDGEGLSEAEDESRRRSQESEARGIVGHDVTRLKKRVGRITPAKRRDGEISIVVGGQRFVVESKLFFDHPDTMLGRMFGSSLDLDMTRPNENGDFVIAHPVSAAAFGAILNFYRRGEVQCPPNVSTEELSEACKYFLIPFTHTSIKCQNVRHGSCASVFGMACSAHDAAHAAYTKFTTTAARRLAFCCMSCPTAALRPSSRCFLTKRCYQPWPAALSWEPAIATLCY